MLDAHENKLIQIKYVILVEMFSQTENNYKETWSMNLHGILNLLLCL